MYAHSLTHTHTQAYTSYGNVCARTCVRVSMFIADGRALSFFFPMVSPLASARPTLPARFRTPHPPPLYVSLHVRALSFSFSLFHSPSLSLSFSLCLSLSLSLALSLSLSLSLSLFLFLSLSLSVARALSLSHVDGETSRLLEIYEIHLTDGIRDTVDRLGTRCS